MGNAGELPKDLGSYSDAARVLTIDGVEYPITPMLVGDMAAGQSMLRDARFASSMAKLRHIPISDSVVAETLSRIEIDNPNPFIVLNEHKCRVYLLSKSLERGQWRGGSLDDMTHETFIKVFDAFCFVSGLGGDGQSDPFLDTTASEKK